MDNAKRLLLTVTMEMHALMILVMLLLENVLTQERLAMMEMLVPMISATQLLDVIIHL
jgi:hypothetical protein